jgi:hypothetical protein
MLPSTTKNRIGSIPEFTLAECWRRTSNDEREMFPAARGKVRGAWSHQRPAHIERTFLREPAGGPKSRGRLRLKRQP